VGGTWPAGRSRGTITVANAGPSRGGRLVVSDPLPAAVLSPSAVASAGSCAIAAGTVSCSLGTVAPNAGVTIAVNGTLDPAFRGFPHEQRRGVVVDAGPNTGNASAPVTSTVGGAIDLVITKTVDRSQGALTTTAAFSIVPRTQAHRRPPMWSSTTSSRPA
jgi:hypothetical protein